MERIGYAYQDHLNRWRIMEPDEVEAIERSGRSSLERYRHGIAEAPDTGITTVVNFLAVAGGRPTPSEPNAFPVEMKWVPATIPPKPRARKTDDRGTVWHLRVGEHAACLAKRTARADVFGYTRFTRLHEHRYICPRCRVIWLQEGCVEDGSKRQLNRRTDERTTEGVRHVQ